MTVEHRPATRRGEEHIEIGVKGIDASGYSITSRSQSWTGNSLASSFDGCEFEIRGASVVPPHALDATSLRLHEGLVFNDAKYPQHPQECPASVESSASGLLLRTNTGTTASHTRASPNVTQQCVPSRQSSAICADMDSSPCQLQVRVSNVSENSDAQPQPWMVSDMGIRTCSHRYPGKPCVSSPPKPHGHLTKAEFTWQAHPETKAAVLEMLDEEVSAAINPNYMDFHSDAVMPDGLCITPAMRLMTINWMSEAVFALDLDQRVVAMAVNLLDRYLSASRQFPRTMLQLAAASAIFIASKIEGVLPHPRASRVAALSDGAFDLERLIAFERVMCHSLGFDLYSPTTQNFLDMWMYALPTAVGETEKFYCEKVHSLASYILELGSLVYDTLRHKRSLLATAALILALSDPGLQSAAAIALRVPLSQVRDYAYAITGSLRHYIGPHTDIVEVTVATAELLRLHRLAKAPENREQFVIAKFSSARFDCIADVAQPLDTKEEFETFMQVYYGNV